MSYLQAFVFENSTWLTGVAGLLLVALGLKILLFNATWEDWAEKLWRSNYYSTLESEESGYYYNRYIRPLFLVLLGLICLISVVLSHFQL